MTYPYQPVGDKPIKLGQDGRAAIQKVLDLCAPAATLAPLTKSCSAYPTMPQWNRGRELIGQFIFGTLRGERYTNGGWKSVLKVLMDACAAEAEKRGVALSGSPSKTCVPKA